MWLTVYPTFNALYDMVRKCFFLLSSELWHFCTWLSVGFPFPIGQVRSQVWCSPYLTANFGFFKLWTFPWSPSKVQVSMFYLFTLKVGSKCTWIILTSSSVKPTIVTLGNFPCNLSHNLIVPLRHKLHESLRSVTYPEMNMSSQRFCCSHRCTK